MQGFRSGSLLAAHIYRAPRGGLSDPNPQAGSGAAGLERFQPQSRAREAAQRPHSASCRLARPPTCPCRALFAGGQKCTAEVPRAQRPRVSGPEPICLPEGHRLPGTPSEGLRAQAHPEKNMPLGGRKGRNVGPLACLACPGLTNTAKGSGKVIAGKTALEPRGPGGDSKSGLPDGLRYRPGKRRTGGRAPSRYQAARPSVFGGCGPGGWGVSKAVRPPAWGRNGDGRWRAGWERSGPEAVWRRVEWGGGPSGAQTAITVGFTSPNFCALLFSHLIQSP